MGPIRRKTRRQQKLPALKTFAYAALPNSATHIRLLKIKRGEAHTNPVCYLSTFPLSRAPRYTAVSYTWGNPRLTHQIVIDGLCFAVRENCHTALWQVREFQTWSARKIEYIWIDAICVNQEDVAEKSMQVNLMGRIYTHAESVLACLGMRSDDIDAIFEYRAILLAWVKTKSNKRLHGGAITETTKRLLDAYETLNERLYFTRVWIIQELFLGSNIMFMCGTYTVDWNLVKILDKYYRANTNKQSMLDVANSKVMPHIQNPRSKRLPLRWLLQVHREWACKGRKVAFTECFTKFSELLCSDPRDHIYGFGSILYSIRNITPDYSLTCFDLAAECLHFLELDTYYSFHDPVDLTEKLLSVLRVHSSNPQVRSTVESFETDFTDQCAEKRDCWLAMSELRTQAHHQRAPSSNNDNSKSEPSTLHFCHTNVFRIQQTENGDLESDLDLDEDHLEIEMRRWYDEACDLSRVTYADFGNGSRMERFVPRVIKSGLRTAGILCAQSRPGDYCLRLHNKEYQPHRILHPVLIVRQLDKCRLHIVGQGLMSSSCKQLSRRQTASAYFSNRADPARRAFPYSCGKLKSNTRDWIVFVAQDLILDRSRGSLVVGCRKLQLQRLFTGATCNQEPSVVEPGGEYPFSSTLLTIYPTAYRRFMIE